MSYYREEDYQEGDYQEDDYQDDNYQEVDYEVLRSPVVRSPPTDWTRRMSVTEEELDPTYRASSRATVSGRLRHEQAKRELLVLSLSTLLLGIALSYLWPSLSSAVGRLNSAIQLPSPEVLYHPSHYHARNSSSSASLQGQSPYSSASTSTMASFWHDYREILTSAEDYETYFHDADASQHAINIMWAVQPPPAAPHEEAAYTRTQKLIESRAENLKLARAEWRKFLTRRGRLVGDMVSSGALWRVYVDGKPVNGTEASEIGKNWAAIAQRFEPSPRSAASKHASVADHEDRSDGKVGDEKTTLDNQTFAALALSARRITDELIRGHAELFEDWGSIHENIHEAQNAEKAFIGRLRSSSSKGSLWTAQYATALPQLKKRIDGLQKQHENMKHVLDWLQERFSRDVVEAKEEDQAAWLKSAKELLQAWATVLMDTQEGVLFMLRREDLKLQGLRRSNYDAGWEEWKSRNCGGTSCYDSPSALGNIKRVFVTGKPMAGVAEDERSWSKSLGGDGTPRVWRGVYDKACCENGTLAQLLKYGSKQPAGGKF
ncbi:hypothetical protein HD806DRAFT_78475 [Xylariaceae sp. AK1471]|nr:hypothetical protein HD806DRAFT_78475 [Xylariaceae sp. AK1471]